MTGRGLRYVLSGMLFAGILSGATQADAGSCRTEWKKYKNLDAASVGHKAFASQRTKGAPGACYWWLSHDADEASRRALAACNEWQADSCEIVSVDDKPGRPNLDAYFLQNSFATV